MNTKIKIQQLWDYLKVQDEELLIVRSFNATKNSDEYILARKTGNELEITTTDTMPEIKPNMAFQMIQQIGADGRHKIPSVEQIKRDEMLDY